MMIPVLTSFPHVRETTFGNVKIGKIPTESRPSIDTCPDSCPFKVRNRKGKRSPCYSEKINFYHRSVGAGMRDRYRSWKAHRAEWRARRFREWSRATSKGLPVRFLVHGDVLKFRRQELDREWIADVLVVARAIPGFRGWGYSHAWRQLARHIPAFRKVGIHIYASVHSEQEAREARIMGFRTAYIGEERKAGYNGPRVRMVAGKACPICPQQLGRKDTCLECGMCFGKERMDIVLLTH